MAISGFPESWIKLLFGGVLMLSSRWCGQCLDALLVPHSTELLQHRANKAKTKERNRYIAENREQIGFQYFKSTFLFAGCIAAADGSVCDNEKRLFDTFCSKLQLDKVQIVAALDYFNQGRNPYFDREAAIQDFVLQCGDIEALCESFLQMQFDFIEASGTVVAAELAVIERLSEKLQAQCIYANELEAYRQSAALHAEAVSKQRMESRKRERDKQRFEAEQRQKDNQLTPAQRKLRLAFAILGIQPTKDRRAIKRAYRTQIKRHHPDYLLANGYPESLLQEATERSVKINQAYRLLKETLQFR